MSRENMLHHQSYKHGRSKGMPGPCVVQDVATGDNEEMSNQTLGDSSGSPQT